MPSTIHALALARACAPVLQFAQSPTESHRMSKLCLAALLLTVAGCRDDIPSKPVDGGGGGADGGRDASDAATGVSAAQACGDLAQARCAKRVSCSNGASLTRAFGSMAVCIAQETSACMNGLGAPQTANHPALVEDCVGDYASLTCRDFFDNAPPASCAPLGTRAVEAPCAFNGQCASGYCAGTKTTLCGTCAVSPVADSSCVSSSCGHAQSCVAATSMCEGFAPQGGLCDAGHPCGNGLGCVGDVTASATPGLCQASVATAGAPCGGTLPGCDGTLGLFCGGAADAKTCLVISYVADGQPCGDPADGTHVECTAGGCYTSTGAVAAKQTGTCKADAAEGAACDTALGPQCLTPARCVTTTGSAGACAAPTGASCG
jgi:hypothetical protein